MTNKKNIVIFWGKHKGTVKDPFSFLGHYKPYYLNLFNIIRNEVDLYIVQGFENWQSELFFTNARLYSDAGLLSGGVNVEADAVFDRSGGMTGHVSSDATNHKILNCNNMKKMAKDKWETYERLGKFMAKSRLVLDQEQFRDCLRGLDQDLTYVIKPRYGQKGKGIFIDTPKNLMKLKVVFPVIVQDFLDTSAGIPGLTTGVHDLRVVIVDQKISYVALRQPPVGKLLSNVGQGGTESELKVSDISSQVMAILDKIIGDFSIEFFSPFYSIDFGIDSSGRPYIFEINSQIGFPEPGLEDNELLNDIAQLLIRKANL